MFTRVAPPAQPQEPQEAPFRVLHLQQDKQGDGSFRPDARLALSPALCTSGFWTGLEPQDAHTLVLLLSFLSPNGHCAPAVSQVAVALHCSSAQACSRLLRLTQKEWQGQTLAVRLPRQDGNDAFAPAPHLLAQEHVPQSQGQSREPRPALAGREAVLAYSRDRYAKPRAEVEAGIARRMGWGPPAFEADPPEISAAKQDLYRKMTDVGVTREQAMDALARFSLSQIGRQLDWLPLRNAKNPARFLLAAIEGNYDPPIALRKQSEAKLPQYALEPPSDLPSLPSDLSGLAEDVFGEDARQGTEDGDHAPLYDPAKQPDSPEEPGLPEGTLYAGE